MSPLKTRTCLLAAACTAFLLGCKENTSSDVSNMNDTTTIVPASDPSPAPAYDPAMDAYLMGGDGIKQLSDTLGVKIYEFAVAPGESWGLHTHPDHTVYVLEGGTMALYMEEAGRTDTLTFPTGMAFLSGPLTDSGSNVGKTTIKMVVTDIYRSRE
jgi:hypothetical protein